MNVRTKHNNYYVLTKKGYIVSHIWFINGDINSYL
jgi:hypothetical protein